MTLADPEDEKRVRELELLARVKIAGLLRAPSGGIVTVRYVVEGGKKPRISRDSSIAGEEKPLTREAV